MLKVLLNTEKLKRFNTDLVRSVMKAGEPVTKNSVAAETGLSLSTCANILSGLLEMGEISEFGMAASTGGRPSRRYVYNHNFQVMALIYPRLEKKRISLHISVVNTAGEPLFEEIRELSYLKGDDLLSLSSELAESYDNLSVLSFGVPAVVQNGYIGHCEIAGLSNLDLKGVLVRKYGLTVSVENDVNCAALGYWDSLGTLCPESLVYMYYPEDGISGAGIVVNGRVLRGHRDFAGEISFLPLGTSMAKQGRIQRNPKKFTDQVDRTVQSINCLINPGRIIISANWVTQDLREQLLESIEHSSPPGQIPVIDFDPQMDLSYKKGLIRKGLRLLSCGFDVVGQ